MKILLDSEEQKTHSSCTINMNPSSAVGHHDSNNISTPSLFNRTVEWVAFPFRYMGRAMKAAMERVIGSIRSLWKRTLSFFSATNEAASIVIPKNAETNDSEKSSNVVEFTRSATCKCSGNDDQNERNQLFQKVAKTPEEASTLTELATSTTKAQEWLQRFKEQAPSSHFVNPNDYLAIMFSLFHPTVGTETFHCETFLQARCNLEQQHVPLLNALTKTIDRYLEHHNIEQNDFRFLTLIRLFMAQPGYSELKTDVITNNIIDALGTAFSEKLAIESNLSLRNMITALAKAYPIHPESVASALEKIMKSSYSNDTAINLDIMILCKNFGGLLCLRILSKCLREKISIRIMQDLLCVLSEENYQPAFLNEIIQLNPNSKEYEGIVPILTRSNDEHLLRIVETFDDYQPLAHTLRLHDFFMQYFMENPKKHYEKMEACVKYTRTKILDSYFEEDAFDLAEQLFNQRTHIYVSINELLANIDACDSTTTPLYLVEIFTEICTLITFGKSKYAPYAAIFDDSSTKNQAKETLTKLISHLSPERMPIYLYDHLPTITISESNLSSQSSLLTALRKKGWLKISNLP